MYAMIAVAVLLAGALAYIWWEKSSLVNELNIDKQELTRQMIDLQNDYASLSSDYESINSQLDSSREEVSQLIERIKKTDAANRSKMRQYEKELGTLRSIMRNYIVQIDSLNTKSSIHSTRNLRQMPQLQDARQRRAVVSRKNFRRPSRASADRLLPAL